MSKSRIFLYLLLSFIGGVFMRSFFEINESFSFLFLILSLVIIFIFYRNSKAAIAAFIFIFFLFGIYKVDSSLKNANASDYLNKQINEESMMMKSSDSTFGQNLIIRLQNEKIDVQVSTPSYPSYAYGEKLKVECVLKKIENTSEDFDYRMYMAKENVFYKCEKPRIEKTGEDEGNYLYEMMLSVRSLLENNILKVIPKPEGALASGLLFGGNSGLSKEIQNDFSRTGMTHIVAVSGYNVTIIAEYLIAIGIFFGLWRKNAVWFAIGGIILFVVASGMPASAVRAGFMATILLWAMKNGRLASAENAIIFAAAIMLFLNPLLLRYDIGFQLSFLATLGIVTTSPFWEKSFIKKHKAFGISEMMAMSLSAQIFVLPVIAYNFHMTSLISLLANIFILPIIPISMLLVFLVSITGIALDFLSLVIAWIAYLPLLYEIKLIHMMASFSWASVTVEKVNVWWIIIYYLILIMSIYLLRRHELEKNKEN